MAALHRGELGASDSQPADPGGGRGQVPSGGLKPLLGTGGHLEPAGPQGRSM